MGANAPSPAPPLSHFLPPWKPRDKQITPHLGIPANGNALPEGQHLGCGRSNASSDPGPGSPDAASTVGAAVRDNGYVAINVYIDESGGVFGLTSRWRSGGKRAPAIPYGANELNALSGRKHRS
jgi:hypothetical protein